MSGFGAKGSTPRKIMLLVELVAFRKHVSVNIASANIPSVGESVLQVLFGKGRHFKRLCSAGTLCQHTVSALQTCENGAGKDTAGAKLTQLASNYLFLY